MINLSEEQLEELKKECFYRTLQKFSEIYKREDITQEEKKNLIRKELQKNNQFIENLVFPQFKQANQDKEITLSEGNIMGNFSRMEPKKQGISEETIEVFNKFNASTDKRIIIEILKNNNTIRKKLQKARIEYIYNPQEEENINE